MATEPRAHSELDQMPAPLRVLLQHMAPRTVWAGDGENARRCRTIVIFWLVGALPWPLVFAFIYGVILDCSAGALICLCGFAGFLPIPALLRCTGGPMVAAQWLVAGVVTTLTALASITGGGGAPALTWLLVVPLIAIHMLGLRHALIWCGISLACLAAFDLLEWLGIEVKCLLSADALSVLASLGNAGVVLLIATLAGTYDAQRQSAMRLAKDREIRLGEALERTEEHAIRLAESEAALRHEKRFSEAVFESLPGTAYVFDEQGRFIRWNGSYARDLGWSDADMARINALDTVSPADRERVATTIKQVFEVGYAATDLDVLAADGRTAPYFCTGVRVELGGRKYLVGVGTEVSQLRKATEALRASEALYRSLVHNSPMGMHFYELAPDDSLLFTAANPAADQLTGIDSSTQFGMPIEQAFPALVGTEIPGRYRAAARDAVPWTAEQVRYDDGRCAGVFEVRAFQTAPRKMVAVFLNVTDRVRAEAALRESEREIALQAGKAEVATDVLHNVGNVLSRVRVATSLLSERIRNSEIPTIGLVANALAEHRSDLERYLVEDERGRALPAFLGSLAGVLAAEQESMIGEFQTLAEAVEHVALIVSMQQIHSCGHGLVELVRPADVVEQAINISISSNRRASVNIVRAIDEIETIPLYRHKVLQILVNLLNNAKHAVLAGGGEGPQITIAVARVVRPGFDGIRFSVSDNGVGITPNHLEKMFTFGFTTRKDGHGFGLHSAANLAQEMGGSIRVASEGAGRGAAFTLELPLAAERVPS